jgi:uncharacterized protein YndB with AHSA1/START domain
MPSRPQPAPEPHERPSRVTTEPAGGFELARVERSVRIDAPAEVVWRSLTDAEGLGTWLGGEVVLDRPLGAGAAGQIVEPDGSVRRLLVTDAGPGRLAWHWWREGGDLSSVEIEARPDGDATEVRVVEVVALATATAGGSTAKAMALGDEWDALLPGVAARLGRKLGVLSVR